MSDYKIMMQIYLITFINQIKSKGKDVKFIKIVLYVACLCLITIEFSIFCIDK